MEIEDLMNMNIFDVLTEKACGNITKEEYMLFWKHNKLEHISFI